MFSRKLDLLLAARPDHSYQIYKQLLKSDIRFKYFTFKLFPYWLRHFLNSKRIRFAERNYTLCYLLTIVHLLRIFLKRPALKKLERPLFLFKFKLLQRFLNVKVIHYWPNYCLEAVINYRKRNNRVLTYADIYYPCEKWVLETVRPEVDALTGNIDWTEVETNAKRLDLLMQHEQNFFVPSDFVANTYRKYYPDKNYIIVPYLIQRWEGYQMKPKKSVGDIIQSFVYVGTISVEKGCDILLNYFSKNDHLELHLYGNVNMHQVEFFSKYQNVSNIYFHGSVPKVEVQNEISKYDVGIHLSRFDAYGLAPGEVIGAGLPMIVTATTGISDLVKDIDAGYVLNDYGDLEKTIASICENENYNRFINNIDAYLSESHSTYEELVLNKYKQSIDGYENS